MNTAIEQMLEHYACRTRDNYLNALREILQQQIKQETDRYVRNKSSLALWSREFFLQIVDGIETV